MAQHGQVLRLKARRGDGKLLWAYRYRVNGSCSKRRDVRLVVERTRLPSGRRKKLAGAPTTGSVGVADYVTRRMAVVRSVVVRRTRSPATGA